MLQRGYAQCHLRTMMRILLFPLGKGYPRRVDFIPAEHLRDIVSFKMPEQTEKGAENIKGLMITFSI